MQPPPPPSSRPNPLVGTLLGGKWLVDGELGAGGMGTVYSAVHQHNARRVAIKVLSPTFASDSEVRERFYQEAYAANCVLHPGTVAALDDGVLNDGTPFLVMEFLEGRDLEKCLNDAGGTLDEIYVLRIMNELLAIVEAAHDAGVLHRDIKPENIFCTSDGKVKLLDFGIAKIADSRRSHQTQCGSTIGTPAFMPPEQARGRWDELDARSDLWSAGATMFTLLSGRMVHQRDTVNEQLLSAMTEPPISVHSVAPHLSTDVVEIVDRALQFKQSDRFQSASEMRQALTGALVVRGELPQSPSLIFGPASEASRSRPRTTHRPVVSTQTTVAVGPRSSRLGSMAAMALLVAGAAGAFYFVSRDVSTLPITSHVQAATPAPRVEVNENLASVEFAEPQVPKDDTTAVKPEFSPNDEIGSSSPRVTQRESGPQPVRQVTPLSAPAPAKIKQQATPPPEGTPPFDPLAQRR